MEYVYVVLADYGWEGKSIVSIFRNEEDADNFIEQTQGSYTVSLTVENWRMW